MKICMIVFFGLIGLIMSCLDGHTKFFLGKLDQAVDQYFLHILPLVTDNKPS